MKVRNSVRPLGIVCSLLVADSVAAQASWSMLYPTVSPPARQAAVMGSHDASGKIVLFSGAGSLGSGWTRLSDCWILDGTVWSEYVGVIPQSRINSAMAYDEVRERLVMFSGDTSQGVTNDTWEWDGSSWTQRFSAVNPPPRSFHAMAFDPVRGVTVLFGGRAPSGSGNYLGDVWEWDGTVWTDVTPTGGPGPLYSPVLAFDPVRLDIVMHGGVRYVAGTNVTVNETWSWDGVSWLQQTPITPPWFRGEDRVVTDLHRQRVLLHGGSSGDPSTWEWDGSQWSMRTGPSPGPRASSAMAYDATSRRVVLFGGSSYFGNVDDTWVLATPSIATAAPYGSGCPGSAGTPYLENAPYNLPWLGDTARHLVTNLAPGSPGSVFVSSFTQSPPVSLAAIGMPGCNRLLAIDALEFRAAVAGVVEWTLQIPNVPSLAGVPLYQQAFPLDQAANALGLTASNGIIVTPGIR